MIISEPERSESKSPIMGGQDSVVPLREQPLLIQSPPSYTSATLAGPASTSYPARPSIPRCNHLLERKTHANINGTWHVDASLEIPDSLLPPINEFDGRWNKRAQSTRKAREQAERKKTGQPQSPTIPEVRPSLMLVSEYGMVRGEVNVISNDDSMRQAVIVTETRNGSIDLSVNVSPRQSLRIHAYSTYGTVKVWIPSSFNGALIMCTEYGKIKISDGVKAKLTTFSTTSNTSRCFVGDWQSSGFGKAPSSSQPSDLATESIPTDPFFGWPGSFVDIGSRNGSVSLSFIEEKADASSSSDSGKSPRGFRSFVSGLFGRSGHETANPSVDVSPLEKPLPPFPDPGL
ncbi:hypothetical protein FRC12_005363 [Ceratobasidium sp. 428]|nr:hypothetical protein FRC12_005363 [Ceratobasidium sp. 428]